MDATPRHPRGLKQRLEELTSRPLVRVALALLGLGMLAAVVLRAGVSVVLRQMHDAAPWLPLLVAFEAAWLACAAMALRSLFGARGPAIPARAWIRGSLWSYVLMLAAPLGRAAGEAVRAVILAQHGGGALAGLSAVRLQVVSMYANAIASLVGAAAALLVNGADLVFWVILANAALTAVLGTSVLVAQGSGRAAAWARRVFRVEAHVWEGAMAERPRWWRSLAWESLGRVVQWIQYGLAMQAVSGAFSVRMSLVGQGVHLVAASIGDLIPGQLGVNELNLALAGPAMGMTAAQGTSVGVLIRVGQLGMLGLCLVLLPLVRRRGEIAAARPPAP